MNLTGKRFGRLVAKSKTSKRVKGKVVWLCDCDCGNQVEVISVYLNNGDTKSCGCLKIEMENNNLRERYDEKRVDGIAMHLFGETIRSDNSTGFKGVSRRLTKKGAVRYTAYITVNKKTYYKGGFDTAEEAYINGRLVLEKEHLPKNEEKENKNDHYI